MKVLPFLLIVLSFSEPVAQALQIQPQDDDWCTQSHHQDDEEYARYCEVREFTIVSQPVRVDAGQNGSIAVRAWDREEMVVRARVEAYAEGSEAVARHLVERVELEMQEVIRSRIPSTDRRSWATVSFEIFVPRDSDLDMKAFNGSIAVDGVHGRLSLEAENGALVLQGLGGEVRGRTRNGALLVTLHGTEWEGPGLDVETMNGFVTVRLPEDYATQLQTGLDRDGFDQATPVVRVATTHGRFSLQTH